LKVEGTYNTEPSFPVDFFRFLVIIFSQTSQSDHSNFDHPKMPKSRKEQLSKRATLLKNFEAISKSHAVKAYICFCLDEEDRQI